MPLITTDFAKLHLRVDDTAEDALVDLYVSSAQAMAQHYVDRNIYADADVLADAIAAAPAALASAVATYDAAIEAAEAMDAGTEQEAAVQYAEQALAVAQAESDRTQRGIVVNDQIKAAMLLVAGRLYESRGAAEDMPAAARALLDTVKVYG